jgi:hypothetical protein
VNLSERSLGCWAGAVSFWENGGKPKPMTLKAIVKIVDEVGEIPIERVQLNSTQETPQKGLFLY